MLLGDLQKPGFNWPGAGIYKEVDSSDSQWTYLRGPSGVSLPSNLFSLAV